MTADRHSANTSRDVIAEAPEVVDEDGLVIIGGGPTPMTMTRAAAQAMGQRLIEAADRSGEQASA